MEDFNKEEQVVLVDEHDTELGTMPKQEAHIKGVLHRAISVIIFNSKGEQLVQQRAFSKYHFGGIWSNTCCSHPRKNETYRQAAERRLLEELGIKTPLKEQFHFIYKVHDEKSQLTEHELDHVFTGTFDGEFQFNQEEVADVRWMKTEDLLNEISNHPEKFSFWFKTILEEMKKRKTLP